MRSNSKASKKKLYWQTTYGCITLSEQLYYNKESGLQVSRLGESIKVKCRGYSKLLQRAMVDFGSDESFGKSSQKIKEHYRIDISEEAIKRCTYAHGEQLVQNGAESEEIPEQGERNILVVETDGTMIPVVETTSKKGDRRKKRKTGWKEAVSTLAYQKGSRTPLYAATVEGRDEAGRQMFYVALCAGLCMKSYVHVVADGADWISEKVQFHFGTVAHFLIDLYHLCGYFSNAIEGASIKNKPSYLGRLKALAKKGKIETIVAWLKPYLEPKSRPNKKAPVRAAIRYINNRKGQFDYPTAIENELPIGSGEIEGTHRHLIQKRLKISGAWWNLQNAQKILNLRVARANQDWDSYWIRQKAA